MDYVTWNNDYSVGIFEFDEDHKKLIEYINELHRCVECSLNISTTGKVIEGLVDYTFYHFRNEEGLMEKHSYPGFHEHKKEHNEMIIKMKTFKNKLDSKDATVALELKAFLRTWLVHHILNVDMKYKRFFAEIKID
jgi:hemerythrin-like metal-binding protein